ncbi:hypothetical protein HDF24_11490 [Mucilaginibacter sp. X4EP1]|uniref:hypothetical protein n=1 Tax=Mucilaginibacter sp. X4EP1 TaxID=2723092 RepID=UPI0021672A88|nr:hypothetical protein [Mucilaginibacter sp. X4EP1]
MKQEKDIDYSRNHNLTIEEVKTCPLFSHLTDQEAEEVIETLKLFTKITYDYYQKSRKILGK